MPFTVVKNLLNFVMIAMLVTVHAFAEGNKDNFQSNINVGLVKEYLRNGRGDVIGVILKDGRRARFPFPLSAYTMMRILKPRDGVEVTFRLPVRAEDYRALILRSTMDAGQGLTDKTPLISNIKESKNRRYYCRVYSKWSYSLIEDQSDLKMAVFGIV